MDINYVYNSKTNKVISVVIPEEMKFGINNLNEKFPRRAIKSKKNKQNRSELIRGSLFLTSSIQKLLSFENYNDIENYTNDLIELIKLGQEVKEARQV